MKNNSKDRKVEGTRLELKYCEHCGALWLREPGGEVYCANCRPQVADLPAPKKKPRGAILPVRQQTEIENYPEMDDTTANDFEAAGGAA